MIRLHYYSQGELQNAWPVERLKDALQDPQGLVWLDFSGEEPAACEPILLKTFSFHPLAVDDALRETHVPKIDDWENYLYIVLRDINFHHTSGDIDAPELDVFLGKNFIVTHHDLTIPSLDRVWNASYRDDRTFHHGADHIMYRLTDELTADYMQVVEEMDEEIELVEDQVFNNPSPSIVQRIFTLKLAALHLRRMMSPLREVMNKLARDDYAVVDAKDQVYFRDVYDHLVRLHDISESLRDLVGGVLDTYLSVVNNRMNEVMKTLTIITTLFMPLSFVAGFFGMNFFLPEKPITAFMTTPVFIGMLIFLLVTPTLMFAWFRRRKWM